MRIAVFGASGGTGRLLVADALAAGREVRAVVRREGALDPAPGLGIVLGDARDPVVVRRALEGVDAVVSTMAIRAGVEPTTDLSDATRVVAETMTAVGVARLVVTANTTVLHADPVKEPYAIVAAEHRRNLAMLRATALAWTVVVTGFLDDDLETGGYRTAVDAKPPSSRITRAAFARAALDALDHDEWVGHVVGVSA
ncbi:MAG TPA: NAD(P)H-binding protein [Actinomycetota bacterium]